MDIALGSPDVEQPLLGQESIPEEDDSSEELNAPQLLYLKETAPLKLFNVENQPGSHNVQSPSRSSFNSRAYFNRNKESKDAAMSIRIMVFLLLLFAIIFISYTGGNGYALYLNVLYAIHILSCLVGLYGVNAPSFPALQAFYMALWIWCATIATTVTIVLVMELDNISMDRCCRGRDKNTIPESCDSASWKIEKKCPDNNPDNEWIMSIAAMVAGGAESEDDICKIIYLCHDYIKEQLLWEVLMMMVLFIAAYAYCGWRVRHNSKVLANAKGHIWEDILSQSNYSGMGSHLHTD